MFALVLAGEMVFSLPFHLPRFFRPTVLEVFGFSNADLGDVFAPYGVIAMLSYFPGGVIADHFSARKLMSLSLVATAAGGLYCMTLPGILGMSILYAFWGGTTVLLFWGALIRATRTWGGQLAQGRGFGLLEGGRGLVAALVASLGVLLLSARMGADSAIVDPAERAAALQTVIFLYTVATFATAAVAWWCIPDPPAVGRRQRAPSWSEIRKVLGFRAVWLQAVIVVCAYCGYKGLDNYSLYAYDALGMSETEAAGFSATTGYIRPFGAILAGFMGDRFGISRMVVGLFASLASCWALLGFLETSPGLLVIVYGNLLISIFGVYALRGLYFGLLEESRVPYSLTGSAVGVVSVVGFTPDAFFGLIAGRLLDATSGIGGHQHVFMLLSGIAAAGLVAATVLNRGISRSQAADSRISS